MYYKELTTTLFLLCLCVFLNAQNINIIPQPKTVEVGKGNFSINEKTAIVYNDPQLKFMAEYTAVTIRSLNNIQLTSKKQNGLLPVKKAINLILDAKTNITKEGYILNVSSKEISIKGSTSQGLFYGVQSLLQLILVNGDSNIPAVEINDEPRFSWRGFMFDVSRHFFTIDELKVLINQMAMYKFNIFHLHLTDDQGWRIEIKSLPKLTQVGAWRVKRTGNWKNREPARADEETNYGGFYTQEQIKELIKYAAERNIQIMPEIDIPGHSLSAIASYPYLSCTRQQYHIPVNHSFYGKESNALCAGRDSTFEFLEKVFSEVASLFPFEYIHIGGDECYRGFWDKCADCQKRMQENNLKDVKELQSYFIKRVGKMLEAKGKKIVGWGEILDGGLAPSATVMSWIDMNAGIEAAKQNHNVIMTPRFPTYMDYYQGEPNGEPLAYRENRLKTCYDFEPVPVGVNESLVLGGQTCLWGELTPNFRHAQYLFWPRSMALAEVYWSPKSNRNWGNFITRLEPQLRKFDKLDYKYAKSYLDAVVKPKFDKNDSLQIQLGTEIKGLDIYYTFDNTFPDKHSTKYQNGQVLDIPKNSSRIILVTYKDDKQAGKIITVPIADLRKRAKDKKVQGALDFEFE
jgi:hexosaminidase